MSDAVMPGRTLGALRHRNYRLFLVGQIVSTIGTWMQTVALPWLALQLTHDGFLVGLVLAAQFLPVLVNPPERLLEERRLRIPWRHGPLDDVQLPIVQVERRHRARSVAVCEMHQVTANAVTRIPCQLRHLRVALDELPRRVEQRALVIEAPVSQTGKTGASIAAFGA